VGLRRFVTLRKLAPYRNSLSLLTYLLVVVAYFYHLTTFIRLLHLLLPFFMSVCVCVCVYVCLSVMGLK